MGPELVLDRGLGLFEEFRARLFLGGNRAFRSVEQRGGQDVFPQQRAGVLDLTVSR